MSPQTFATSNVAPRGDEIHYIGAGYFEPHHVHPSPSQQPEDTQKQVHMGSDAHNDPRQIGDATNAESGR